MRCAIHDVRYAVCNMNFLHSEGNHGKRISFTKRGSASNIKYLLHISSGGHFLNVPVVKSLSSDLLVIDNGYHILVDPSIWVLKT